MVADKKLRILLLADSRTFHVERYVPELLRQNCEVLLASIENGPVAHYQLRRRGPIRQLHYSLAAPQLQKLIKEYSPDVVDVQDANYGYLAALALKKMPVPVNLQVLGSDILIVPHKSIFHRLKTVRALKRANAIIADSEYLLQESKKLCPITNAVVDTFGIEQKYLELHKTNYTLSRPLKIIVPRLQDKIYNNLFIVQSLAGLLKSGTVTLTFQDLGLTLEEFKSELSRLDLPGISFYQRTDRDTFMKLMAAHDIYLSASLSDSSPVTLIESMALGLIPVVADIPGVKEWTGNSSAFTYPVNDESALESIVAEIARGESTFSEMRRQNVEKVKAKAIFENNVAFRINTMRQLVDKK